MADFIFSHLYSSWFIISIFICLVDLTEVKGDYVKRFNILNEEYKGRFIVVLLLL
jgi:hypothetical protein